MFKVIKSKQVRNYFVELQQVHDHPDSPPTFDVLVDFGEDSLNMSRFGFKELPEAEKYFETFKDKRGAK